MDGKFIWYISNVRELNPVVMELISKLFSGKKLPAEIMRLDSVNNYMYKVDEKMLPGLLPIQYQKPSPFQFFVRKGKYGSVEKCGLQKMAKFINMPLSEIYELARKGTQRGETRKIDGVPFEDDFWKISFVSTAVKEKILWRLKDVKGFAPNLIEANDHEARKRPTFEISFVDAVSFAEIRINKMDGFMLYHRKSATDMWRVWKEGVGQITPRYNDQFVNRGENSKKHTW